MTTKLTHHHLTAEQVDDEHGTTIMLTQQEDGYSEPNTVLVARGVLGCNEGWLWQQ